MSNEKFLSDIRQAVKAFTEADPYFSDIPIVTERLKDIDGKLQEALSKISGLAIVLVTPRVGGVLANINGANFKEIVIVARIFEDLTLNKTGKEALDVAIYLCALWSQAKPDQLSAALIPSEPPIVLGNDPRFLSYDVIFTTESGTKIQIPRLESPTLDASDLGAIAFSGAEPGAAIFYTLDGTQPAPRNPASALYLAPFSSSPASTLRARAWLAGYLPSAEIKTTL